MQTVPNQLLPVRIQSVLLPHFSANLISTPSGGADWPNSYFESWAWLMPRTLANSSWVVPALNCLILPPTPRKSTSLSDRRGRPPNFFLTIFILRVFFLRVHMALALGPHSHQRCSLAKRRSSQVMRPSRHSNLMENPSKLNPDSQKTCRVGEAASIAKTPGKTDLLRRNLKCARNNW